MRAFSLIETIVVIAVTFLLGMTINSLIVTFYRSNAYVLQESTAVDSAHRGLETSFEDLREASYGDDGSYPIQSAATSTVTFFSDIDGDGSVEKIRLYLSNGTFYRGVTDSAGSPPSYTGQPEKLTSIATFVRNSTSTPIFTYYDNNGVSLGTTSIDVSKISAVAVSVMVDVNPNRAPEILTLSGEATLRNLRTQ